MRNTKVNIYKQPKEKRAKKLNLNQGERKKYQKRVCQYCQHNEYKENYSHHLRSQHKKELGIRQLVKSLNSEELEQVNQFILKEVKKK